METAAKIEVRLFGLLGTVAVLLGDKFIWAELTLHAKKKPAVASHNELKMCTVLLTSRFVLRRLQVLCFRCVFIYSAVNTGAARPTA